MRWIHRIGDSGTGVFGVWRCFAFIASLLLAVAPLRAQTIPLTDKLTSLEGRWTRDPARGAGGICGVPVPNAVAFKVSPTEVRIDSDMVTGAYSLAGAQTTLSDGRTATTALDAGWLAVTMRRQRGTSMANVMHEVYIVTKDELTIWRTLNVELTDGGQGKIDCGNHQAIVYTKSPAR